MSVAVKNSKKYQEALSSGKHSRALSKALKGKKFSPSHLENVRKNNASLEHRMKISAGKKGKLFTDEHKAALRAAKRGKIRVYSSERTFKWVKPEDVESYLKLGYKLNKYEFTDKINRI